MNRDDMTLEEEKEDIIKNIKNLEYELSVAYRGTDEYHSIQEELSLEMCLLEDINRKLKALEEEVNKEDFYPSEKEEEPAYAEADKLVDKLASRGW